jgi:hypothetical protein
LAPRSPRRCEALSVRRRCSPGTRVASSSRLPPRERHTPKLGPFVPVDLSRQ